MKPLHHAIRTVAALVTPFTPDDRVHREALAGIVEHAIEFGVGGFYVCGSTGEGFQMSSAERREVVDSVVTATAGRVAVVVNVSHMDFREAVALADHAQEVGADAVSSLPPIYNPVTPSELLIYVRTLLDRVRLPFMLYHIPMLTAQPLGVAAITELAKHPLFVGLKYSSEDAALLTRLKEIGDRRMLIWSGRDAYFLSNLAMGADGAVGGSLCLMPDLFNRIYTLYHAGEPAAALDLQQRVNEIHRRLGTYGPYQSYKACFEIVGIPAGTCRLPFAPLPPAASAHLHEAMQMLDEVRATCGEAIVASSPHVAPSV